MSCLVGICSSTETQEASEGGGSGNAEPGGLPTGSAPVRCARIQRGDRVQPQLRLRWTQVHPTGSKRNTARQPNTRQVSPFCELFFFSICVELKVNKMG